MRALLAAVPKRLSRRGLMARRALATLLLTGMSWTVALAMGEVLVRIAAPQQLILKRPDIWRAVDTLGWVHAPGINVRVNTGERTVRFLTDERGFRVGPGPRQPARRRILLLGDSFMEAMQVEYEQSTAGLLAARLSRRLGEPVALANAAVGGWDPPQYLMEARAVLAAEPFDLVLVALYLGNDIVTSRPDQIPPRTPAEVHPFHVPRRLTFREFAQAIAYPINDFLEVRSHLFIFVKRRTETLLMRLGLTAAYFPEELLRREAGSPRWSVTADICRDIADEALRHGTPTLFVLLPTPFQVDSAEFWTFVRGFRIDPAAVDLDQPNRLLGQALQARHLSVLDVAPQFRAAHHSGEELYGHVDRHFSPAGHELLERLLEPVVMRYLGGEPPPVAVPVGRR